MHVMLSLTCKKAKFHGNFHASFACNRYSLMTSLQNEFYGFFLLILAMHLNGFTAPPPNHRKKLSCVTNS